MLSIRRLHTPAWGCGTENLSPRTLDHSGLMSKIRPKTLSYDYNEWRQTSVKVTHRYYCKSHVVIVDSHFNDSQYAEDWCLQRIQGRLAPQARRL